MADSFVSFSNQNSLDFFPSFKSSHKPKDDQGAFTIDNRDLEEMRKNISTNESKQNNASLGIFKKAISNPLAMCDICSVSISSQTVYNTHIKGKKHQTQLTALLSKNPEYKTPTYKELCSNQQESIVINNQNEKSVASLSELTVSENNKESILIPSKMFNCNICNISCNSQQMFDNHIGGKKHQTKLKFANLTTSAPPRNVPDNNPSSSNYCDVCSLQLNSEDELTEHLAHKRHQTQVKEDEICAKEASDMKINFEDYKISTEDTGKHHFNYQCAKCNKTLQNKTELIDHLKSAFHIKISNQSNNQCLSKISNRENHQATGGDANRGGTTQGGATQGDAKRVDAKRVDAKRGGSTQGGTTRRDAKREDNTRQGTTRGITARGGTTRGGTMRGGTMRGGTMRGDTMRGSTTRGGVSTRSQSFSASRGSNKHSRKSRPYPSERSSYQQSSQAFDQQTSNDIFGAFAPNNQSTFNSNSNSYSRTKHSIEYEENPNEYDGFYPKRSRTYKDEADNSQNFYPTEGFYYTPSTLPGYPSNSNQYSSQTTDYNNQSLTSEASWQYQTEPYYGQQQYSISESSYMNPMYYPSNEPPVPNYEPPPPPPPPPSSSSLLNYPLSLSSTLYSQSSAYLGSTKTEEIIYQYPNSFHR